MKYSPSSWPPHFLPNTPHGLGCATTHSHQQDQQGYIKMTFRPCSYLGIIFTLNKHPEMEINPLKMVCGYPCGRVNKQKSKVTHPILSPNEMHFSMYNCTYCATPPPPLPPNSQLGNITTTNVPNTHRCPRLEALEQEREGREPRVGGHEQRLKQKCGHSQCTRWFSADTT